jgi:hypothetical protein
MVRFHQECNNPPRGQCKDRRLQGIVMNCTAHKNEGGIKGNKGSHAQGQPRAFAKHQSGGSENSIQRDHAQAYGHETHRIKGENRSPPRESILSEVKHYIPAIASFILHPDEMWVWLEGLSEICGVAPRSRQRSQQIIEWGMMPHPHFHALFATRRLNRKTSILLYVPDVVKVWNLVDSFAWRYGQGISDGRDREQPEESGWQPL